MVVTKHSSFYSSTKTFIVAAVLVIASSSCFAAVLPEDQTEILYHRYEGGGSTIDGPSVLVRKEFADKVSVWGNYYVDMLSSASIDVVTQGSAYTETRQEASVGFDYLQERTIMSASVSNSAEDDYDSTSVALGLSQEFFGDLSTLSLNYSKGEDEVRRNIYQDGEVIDSEFVGEATHQRFGIGFTQVLLKNWIAALSIESVVDEGFLNNPYRSVRFTNPGTPNIRSAQAENYPTTRNSDALSVRTMVYLPYRAALRLEGRVYQDSWGIDAQNFEVRYVHPYDKQWIFEAKIRHYSQNQASFYSDLFDFGQGIPTFLARDKELSTFTNTSVGLGVSYKIERQVFNWVDEISLNTYIDFIQFDYDNFLDERGDNTQTFGLGNEPAYNFSASVLRFFISAKY